MKHHHAKNSASHAHRIAQFFKPNRSSELRESEIKINKMKQTVPICNNRNRTARGKNRLVHTAECCTPSKRLLAAAYFIEECKQACKQAPRMILVWSNQSYALRCTSSGSPYPPKRQHCRSTTDPADPRQDLMPFTNFIAGRSETVAALKTDKSY